jgi:Na+-driven multidrug efflux pump
MSTGPIVSATVSRMPRALDSLAVWPVINGLTFILRSLGMAVNEVVVAHLDRPGAIRSLRRFSVILGLATTSIFAVVGFTPLARIYFAKVTALSPELTALATKAVRMVVVMPGFGALQSWFQGVLVHSRHTRGITESVVIYLGANLVLLALGIRFVHAPGIFVGLGAVVGAAVCQLFWLWRRSRPALGGLIAGGSGR